MGQRKHYSKEFKTEVVKNILIEQNKDPELSVITIAKEYDPSIPARLVYTWLQKLKEEVRKELDMSENEANNKYGTAANELTLAQKYTIILETAGLSEEEFGTYCRTKGLYASDIARWKTECLDALRTANIKGKDQNEIKKKNSEIKDLKQELSTLKTKYAEQEKQIDKKDKTLAVYAAQVISLKNFHQLFTDQKED